MSEGLRDIGGFLHATSRIISALTAIRKSVNLPPGFAAQTTLVIALRVAAHLFVLRAAARLLHCARMPIFLYCARLSVFCTSRGCPSFCTARGYQCFALRAAARLLHCARLSVHFRAVRRTFCLIGVGARVKLSYFTGGGACTLCCW